MYCTRQRASTCIGFACCPITFKSVSMNNMSVLRNVQQRRELQGEDIYFLLKIKLGTVVPLELEKTPQFIYSPGIKIIPIHIFDIRKLHPFIYYSVIDDPFRKSE